ncbi:MAG: hypothetical protein EOM37_01900 [Proteobacteria bacterium]|jgi:hypothetical protein|nr:hypothetical protein [Alphaproteobacteria bacterium]NCC02789.1 hypothetical protein [Pseudomonadota bacterium]
MILSALTQHLTPVEIGARYRRKGTGYFVETAQVLEVSEDKMGIPHVRFELYVMRGIGQATVETRTLSLEAFQTRFKERLSDGY